MLQVYPTGDKVVDSSNQYRDLELPIGGKVAKVVEVLLPAPVILWQPASKPVQAVKAIFGAFMITEQPAEVLVVLLRCLSSLVELEYTPVSLK
jgi:hypothetical protein